MKKILIRPIITEKTLALAAERNQYTFKVLVSAEKIEIKEAVAAKFEVKVLNVKTVNVLGQKVRFGRKRTEGVRSNYKKAIVTLKKGDTISIFELK